MADLQFVAPTPEHVEALVRNMREADRAECIAAGQPNLHMVVARGVRSSAWSLTALIDGEVAAIIGVAPLRGSLLTDTGVPWMLGTDLVPRHRRALTRVAPGYIARMLQTYPHLINAVHARNTVAVNWLRRVGFTLAPAEPHGPFREPFHVFRMDA